MCALVRPACGRCPRHGGYRPMARMRSFRSISIDSAPAAAPIVVMRRHVDVRCQSGRRGAAWAPMGRFAGQERDDLRHLEQARRRECPSGLDCQSRQICSHPSRNHSSAGCHRQDVMTVGEPPDQQCDRIGGQGPSGAQRRGSAGQDDLGGDATIARPRLLLALPSPRAKASAISIWVCCTIATRRAIRACGACGPMPRGAKRMANSLTASPSS